MNATPRDSVPWLMEVLEAPASRRVWLVGRRVIPAPALLPNTRLFAERLDGDGRTRFEDVTALAGKDLDATGLLRFYRVSVSGAACRLSHAGLAHDGDGSPWDFHLTGSLSIRDPELFFKSGGAKLASPEAPLVAATLGDWLAPFIDRAVREEMKRAQAEFSSLPFDQFRAKDTRPPATWQRLLAGELASRGLALEVAAVGWGSAQAEERQAEAARRAAREEAQRRQEAEREALLRESALAAEFEGRRARAEHEFQQRREALEAEARTQRISRDHELRVLQERHEQELRLLAEEYQKKLVLAEAATQAARQAMELAAEEHRQALEREAAAAAAGREAQAEQARRRERETAEAEARWQREQEASRHRILHDQRLTEAARRAELEKFQSAQEIEVMKYRAAVDASRQARERAEAEHQLALEELESRRASVAGTRLAAARAREWQLEQEALAVEADIEARERAIKHNRALAEVEQAGQIEILKTDYQRRQVEAQSALDRAREVSEKAALDHQQAVIDGQNRIAEAQHRLAQQARERAAEAERQRAEAVARQAELEERLKHDSRLSADQRIFELAWLRLEQARLINNAEETLATARRDAALADSQHQLAVAQARARLQEFEDMQQEQRAARKRRQDAEAGKHRRDEEIAEEEHQARLAEIRAKRAAAEAAAAAAAERQAEDARRQHQQVEASLKELQEHLAKARRDTEIQRLLALLDHSDSREAHQAAESLTQLGYRPETLGALGYRVDCQKFLAKLQAKAARDGHPVTVVNHRLAHRSLDRLLASSRGLRTDEPEAHRIVERILTRDVGPRKVPLPPGRQGTVEHLQINDSLQFEFTTRRTGYVTVLNIGTSGRVWLHVPNFHATAAAARVHTPGSRAVPGPELLPWGLIPGYYEGGPPGYEHIAVLISDQPVVDPAWVRRSTPDDPLVPLSDNEVAHLSAVLASLAPESWTAGVLSFIVM